MCVDISDTLLCNIYSISWLCPFNSLPFRLLQLGLHFCDLDLAVVLPLLLRTGFLITLWIFTYKNLPCFFFFFIILILNNNWCYWNSKSCLSPLPAFTRMLYYPMTYFSRSIWKQLGRIQTCIFLFKNIRINANSLAVIALAMTLFCSSWPHLAAFFSYRYQWIFWHGSFSAGQSDVANCLFLVLLWSF